MKSLKFQITAAMLLLLALFTGATGYTFMALEHQRTNDTILTLASRLQLTIQYLANQAMRYKEHAPRNFDSYHRDLELYYKDLQQHIKTFDMISDAFMHQDFKPEVTGLVDVLHPKLGPQVTRAIADLENAWQRYRRELIIALGDKQEEPRLEWGAEYIINNNQNLELAAEHLNQALHTWSTRDLAQIRTLNHSVLILGSLIAVLVVAWLAVKVLAPLNRTMQGFNQVARGDFGVQVQAQGSKEAVQLTQAFNHLSSRLKVLFDLIDRLQGGSDLNQTLAFLSGEFQTLLRIDWVGILFVTGDDQSARLEASYLDGRQEAAGKQVYQLEGTLLQQALTEGHPRHIPAMQDTAVDNPAFVFLRNLVDKGMRDAIFLPLTEESQSPIPGILVFATRAGGSYDAEHLAFLNNIAQLVTHSFGRTVKLAEHTRLAAIGQFASGIAHEIRSPLATIGMALDHFRKLELAPGSAKRVELAAQEAERVQRMLAEMLLYAKPLKLEMQPLNLTPLFDEFQQLELGLAEASQWHIEQDLPNHTIRILGDRDRLTQVWINLTRNACEAAPPGSTIRWRVLELPETGLIGLQIQNDGDPIPEEVLPRLAQPFFTTKASGTGLGLAIVRRIVEAHGGEMRIASDAARGTRITVSLPRVD